ncbi:MAG: hypothetical protein ABIH42_09405 [Planctomycetota bacterium]
MILQLLFIQFHNSLAQATNVSSVWKILADNAFGITVIFVFASAILAAFFKARSTDKCLRDMRKFQVTLIKPDNKRIWGILGVYSSGIELKFKEPHKTKDNLLKSSYILYSNQFKDIYAIHRYYDELSEQSKKIREKDIKRSYNPSFLRKLKRKLSNFINTLRDAIMRSLDMFLAQVKKASPEPTIVTQQSGEISTMGKEMIGHFGNAFDPILERHIGRKIILEITKDGKISEFLGILKSYSPDFLEILDVQIYMQYALSAGESWEVEPSINITLMENEGKFIVSNTGKIPVNILKVEGENFSKEIQTTVAVDSKQELNPDSDFPAGFKVLTEAVRQVDMIAPRAYSIIRHSAES